MIYIYFWHKHPTTESEIRLKKRLQARRAESVPWADRWTESYSGSKDGHPRDVENTGRNKTTRSRDRQDYSRRYRRREMEKWFKRKYLISSKAHTGLSQWCLLCDEESARKGQTWKWHCRETNKDYCIITLQRQSSFFLSTIHSNTSLLVYLKAITTTSARMVPCMNLWLMQPWSAGELCNQLKKKKLK